MKRTAPDDNFVSNAPDPVTGHGTDGRANLAGATFVHLILLVIACIVTYSNSLLVPFTFDDYAYLIDNPLITDFAIFSDNSLIDSYKINIDLKYNFILRPVTYFTFSLNHLVNGFDPKGFHVVNILIHTANALLLYLLVRQLLVPAARDMNHGFPASSITFVSFFSAMIFAVHPLQTQAVTYIIQRFTSLATLFYLLTIVLYLSFRSTPRKSARVAFYLSALLAAICAMKAKEIAFTLPLVLVMVELFYFKGEWGRRLLGLAPFLLTMVIIPATVLKLSAQSGTIGHSTLEKGMNLVNFSSVSAYDYAITQLRVMVTYLRLLFLPIGQNLDYDYPLYHSILEYPVLLSLMVIVAATGVGIRFFRNSLRGDCDCPIHRRTVSFGIFWFFVAMAVESSVIPLDDMIFEHRVYLPSVGMILASVAALDMFRLKMAAGKGAAGRLAVLMPVLAVIGLSTATVLRNDVWKNIWPDVAKKSPAKARAFVNHGDYLVRTGRSGEAIAWLKQAIERDPDNIDAHLNLGVASCDMGLFAEALAALNFVVAKKPDDELAWNNLATVYARQGDFVKAVEMYQRCVLLNPGAVSAQSNLDQAIRDLRAVISAE